MKRIVFLGFALISTFFLRAQETISFEGKQVPIQGPLCGVANVNGTILECHYELVEETFYSTIIMKDEAGEINNIEISKTQVKNITDKDFEIDFWDKFGGDLYMSGFSTNNKVMTTIYKDSEVTKYKSSSISLYFYSKQALVDLLDKVKKQRGF